MGHSNALSLIPSNRNEFHGTDCVAGQDGASDLWVCAQRLGHGYGASLEREFAGWSGRNPGARKSEATAM